MSFFCIKDLTGEITSPWKEVREKNRDILRKNETSNQDSWGEKKKRKKFLEVIKEETSKSICMVLQLRLIRAIG